MTVVMQPPLPRRLRIRLKASGPDDLQAALGQIRTERGIFVPSRRMLPLGSPVTVELLYRDGRPAMSGSGEVSRHRAPPKPNPGMSIDVRLRPARGPLREPGIVPSSETRVTGKRTVDAVEPGSSPDRDPSNRDPSNRVPRRGSITQLIIERGRERNRRDTTYETRGSAPFEYVRPAALATLDDVTPLGRAAASLARIPLVATVDEDVLPAGEVIPPATTKVSAPWIGIDFGPTAVRVWVGPGIGGPSTAAYEFESAVFLPGDARPLVGTRAKERLAFEPLRGLTGLSRFLGVPFSAPEAREAHAAAGFVPSTGGRLGIVVDGTVRSVEELSAWLLLEARLAASRSLDRPVRRARVVCSGACGLAARHELRCAAERAGLDLAEIVRGPIAVAGELAAVQKAPGSVWIVDERGRMQPVLPDGSELPAVGRVRRRFEGASERLFVAEDLGGVMVPVAEVGLSQLGVQIGGVDVDLAVTAHGDGALDVHATDACTRAPLGVEIARAVGGFFEALEARSATTYPSR